jgi:CRP/FNR family transcriptional regulator, cyclic AMP receptor protein
VPKSSDIGSFLAGLPVFRGVGAPDLEALVGRLRERHLRKGQVLFREGEVGHEMFFVRRGTLVVSKTVSGQVEQVLARMGPGEFFGEMSLFDGAPRSASVQAEADALLLVLDRDNLQRFTAANPSAAAAFLHAVVLIFIERLRRSDDLVAEVTRWGLEATGLDVESR